MRPAVRVVKLGGSLLDWPELPVALREWLATQPPAANLLIVGGGSLVEAVRALDRIHELSDEGAHWLAIRAMGVTATLVAELLDVPLIDSRVDSQGLREGVCVLNVERLLREDAAGPDPLPASWQVTSDSIAARAARVVGATELVLLKSAPPTVASDHAAWSQEGYVDAYFPIASKGLTVRAVNIRR
jgi:aspartokinase-like uncharacterized kinase